MADEKKKLTAVEQLKKLREAEEEAQAAITLAAAEAASKGERYTLKLSDVVKTPEGAELRELSFRAQRMGDVKAHDGAPIGVISDLTEVSPETLEGVSIFDWDRCLAVAAGFRLRRPSGRVGPT